MDGGFVVDEEDAAQQETDAAAEVRKLREMIRPMVVYAVLIAGVVGAFVVWRQSEDRSKRHADSYVGCVLATRDPTAC